MRPLHRVILAARLVLAARAAFVALAIAISGAGCYPTVPPPANLDGVAMRRFDRVDADLYRSSQPDRAELGTLVARYHFRTVVKLNAGSDDVPAELAATLRVIHEPMSAHVEPPPAQLARVLDAIDAAPKPVLVHCTHGEDRTGLVVALYRIRHGATVADAYADMIRHGFHPYPGVWAAWLRAAGWNRPLNCGGLCPPPSIGQSPMEPPPTAR